jgi:hypothetical protein
MGRVRGRDNDVVDLGKALGNSVLQALDLDAERGVLDDSEHIPRLRSVVEAIVGCLKTRGLASGQSKLVQHELKKCAAELFLQRCREARIAQGEPNDSQNEAADREYFEKLYKSRKRK